MASESINKRRRAYEKRTNKRVMNELCVIRKSLMAKADRTKVEHKYRAYRSAGDALQKLIEDYPGGYDYFWSGRCGF